MLGAFLFLIKLHETKVEFIRSASLDVSLFASLFLLVVLPPQWLLSGVLKFHFPHDFRHLVNNKHWTFGKPIELHLFQLTLSPPLSSHGIFMLKLPQKNP